MVFTWLKNFWGNTIRPILSAYVKPVLTKIDDYASYLPEYAGIKGGIISTSRKVLDALPESIARPISNVLEGF